MRIVLNEFTNTAHKPSREDSSHPAACGALRHVSEEQIREFTADGFDGRINRCGRCFENGGGY